MSYNFDSESWSTESENSCLSSIDSTTSTRSRSSSASFRKSRRTNRKRSKESRTRCRKNTTRHASRSRRGSRASRRASRISSKESRTRCRKNTTRHASSSRRGLRASRRASRISSKESRTRCRKNTTRHASSSRRGSRASRRASRPYRHGKSVSYRSSRISSRKPKKVTITKNRRANKMTIEYRSPSEKDRYTVLQFLLNHFRVTEPITTSLNASIDDVHDFFIDLRDGGFKDKNISTLAFEKGEIVGICLNSLKLEDEINTESHQMLDSYRDYAKDILSGPYPSQNANRLQSFVTTLEEDSAVLLKYPKKILKIDVLCVRHDQQGRGIASSFLRRAIQIAKDENCEWIASAATAHASQKLFIKFGFHCLRELPFSCFWEDGHPVFRNLPKKEKGGKLMAFKIEEDEDDLK